MFGPALTGVVGRKAGSYAGYSYGSDLKAAGDKGLVWTEERLFEWLNDPAVFLQHYLDNPGAASKMPVRFEDAATRKDVIAYLKAN